MVMEWRVENFKSLYTLHLYICKLSDKVLKAPDGGKATLCNVHTFSEVCETLYHVRTDLPTVQ